MVSSFNQVYFFGDSLFDTGNAFQITENTFPGNGFPGNGGTFLPPFPPFPDPYALGRFSSGDIVVDYLADRLNITVDPFLANSFVNNGVNFAIGGATSGNTGAFGATGLEQQVDAFKSLVALESQVSEVILDDDLFFLWIGSNDYYSFIQDDPTTPDIIEANFPETRRDLRSVVNVVVDTNIKGAIQDIIDLGGKNIAVFNLPDLQKTPLGRSLETEDRVSLRKLKNIHNRRLLKLSEEIETLNPDVNVINIDVNELFDDVLRNSRELGFTDKRSNFTGIDLYTGNFQPPSSGDPNEVLFFDSVHPNTVGHSLVADFVIDALTDEGLII